MLLIERGADPTLTCLQEAANNGHVHLVHFFNSLGVQILPQTVFIAQGISILVEAGFAICNQQLASEYQICALLAEYEMITSDDIQSQ